MLAASLVEYTAIKIIEQRSTPDTSTGRKFGKGEQTVSFVVSGEPVKAGIDPYNKLIGRIPTDNVMAVK